MTAKNSKTDENMKFLQRIMEPMPKDWRTRFQVGDKVELMRRDPGGLIPIGATGIIEKIEDGESTFAMKGRPYQVDFDVTEYNLDYPDFVVEAIKRQGIQIANEKMTSILTNVSPNDIRKIASD